MIPQTQKKGRHRRTSRIFRVGRDGSEIHPAHAATRRAVDHPGRVNAVVPQGGDEVQRLPVAVRHARIKTLHAQDPTVSTTNIPIRPSIIGDWTCHVFMPLRPLA